MFIRLKGLSSTGLALLIMLLSISGPAQSQRHESKKKKQTTYFSIPGQDLGKALIEFAAQAQLNLITPAELVKQHQSSPVVGNLETENALQQLLSRAPLSYELNKQTSSLRIVVNPPKEIQPQPNEPAKQFNRQPEEMYVLADRSFPHQGIIIATGIKQQSRGIVDAVAAEKVGEYPEVNIAESLQRVVGVSIDRQNNEGSTVTVRGLSPDFNLITYNGRQMPGVNARSFDFSRLTAENISSVEIYKTGRANVPSGGIGSVINITTHKPLELPSQKLVAEIRALSDTSVAEDNATPELSGLWSIRDAGKTLGLLVSGSYQRRKSQVEEVTITDWGGNLSSADTLDLISSDTNIEGTYWDSGYQDFVVREQDRTKTNGQITLQYTPSKKLLTTLNYHYTETKKHLASDVLTLMTSNTSDIDNNTTGEIINNNGTLVYFTDPSTLLRINNLIQDKTNETNSAGLRIDYRPTDSLELSIDAHNSVAESSPEEDDVDRNLRMNIYPIQTYFDAQNVDIPRVALDPKADNVNLNAQEFGSVNGRFTYNKENTSITQTQTRVQWKDSDNSYGILQSVDFGISYSKVSNRGRFATSNLLFSPSVDSDLISLDYRNGILNEFSGGLGQNAFFFTHDLDETYDRLFDPNKLEKPDQYTTDHRITERTTSTYLQFYFDPNVSGIQINTLAGIRYERTKVAASSLFFKPTALNWEWTSLFYIAFEDNYTYSQEKHSYDTYLPNLDIDVHLSDTIITRFSASRSITRADLSSMQALTELSNDFEERQFLSSRGNPLLEPHISKNLDISAEWYYREDSYLAAGYFYKQVDNFAFDRVVEEPLFGLRDPYSGPRAQAARQQLIDQNIPVTDEAIWDQIVSNEGGAFEVVPNQDDPLVVWQVAEPVNAKRTSIRGWEFALQHVFGASGFGSIANLTLVDSQANLDNALLGLQFARPGVSDSANLIIYYDRSPVQARLAYHWRDEFLSDTIHSGINQPKYTEAYEQLDARLSYEVNEHVSLLFEAINVLGSKQRDYSRYREQLLFASEFKPRYSLGFRVSF